MRCDIDSRIPVIDLFAGPGCLAEGFSAFDEESRNVFRICLSAEKDPYAHSTLELRSFIRQFLYREYLKIIARHWSPVFIMENVKGILSAKAAV